VASPAQVKRYAQGLGVRTKNDKKDSVALARYGHKEPPTGFGSQKRWKFAP